MKLFFIIFFVFSLSSKSIACDYVSSPYVSDNGITWSHTEGCYATAELAGQACEDNELPRVACELLTFHTGDWQGADVPAGTSYYITYGYTDVFKIFWVIGQSCATQRTSASQQCGGDDKYIISDAPYCTYACIDSCSTISNTTVTPLQNCVEQCSQIDAHCGSSGYSMYDGQNCKGTCNPAPDCAQKYEQKSIECKQHIAYWDNATCTGVCEECEQQYLAKKQECANPVPVYRTYNGVSDIDRCKYTCDCTAAMDQANSDCPYGAEFDTSNPSSCSYKCLSCEQLADKCVDKCGTKDNVSVYNCESLNTTPSDYMCECKGNDCKSYYDSCTRSCSTDECGGVSEMKCVEAFGIISYRKCECNGCAVDGKPEKETCSNYTDACSNYTDACANACSSDECGGVGAKQCTDTSTGISNQSCTCRNCGDKIVDGTGAGGTGGSGIGGTGAGGGGTGNPTADPSDQSDLAGWSKGIKGDLDDLVRQSEDQTGWLSKISNNTDKANDYLKTIAGKNVDTAGVINAVNNAKRSIDDGNQKLSELKDGLGELKAGLEDVGIGTSVAGDYTVSEGSYGAVPTDADLPTAEQTTSAFGTFDPGTDAGYRTQISNSLSGMAVLADSPVCSTQISIPWFSHGSLIWVPFDVNFCPYQSYFVLIGNVLVFAFSLRELYMFSS